MDIAFGIVFGVVLACNDGTLSNTNGGRFIGDGNFVGTIWWVGLASIF